MNKIKIIYRSNISFYKKTKDLLYLIFGIKVNQSI